MDINNLTIGKAKELVELFVEAKPKSNLLSEMIGKYVIVRSRNEGVNAGTVKMADETGIILTSARRLWYHKPADKSISWYEGVAQNGVDDRSKLSVAVIEKAIVEDYSITVCTYEAEKSITEVKSYAQS